MGIILAIAVLRDALLVRLMPVPILLRFYRPGRWWRDRWLDQLLALTGPA